jgi:hypothetical protein
MVIFIKTWKNDLKWLKYCLKSIDKYGSGFEVLIVADWDCKSEIESWSLTKEVVHYCRPNFDGYLYQQYIKLRAFDYTDSEFILFMDSDCIFTEPTKPEDFFTDGKPNMLMTPYEDIPEVMFWKEATDKATGLDVKYEFMRRNGLVYHRSTLVGLWLSYSDKFFNQLKRTKNRQFSEFNIIGAYAFEFEQEKYNFVNTRDSIPHHPVKQFWSWSGLNEQDIEELNKHL